MLVNYKKLLANGIARFNSPLPIFAVMNTVSIKIVPLIIGLLFIAHTCSAQTRKEDEIDIAYFHCLDQDTSAGNIGDCAFVAWQVGKGNEADLQQADARAEAKG